MVIAPYIARLHYRGCTHVHVVGHIFEFAYCVEYLPAPSGFIYHAAWDAKLRGGEFTGGAEVDAVLSERVVSQNQYYLETSWRSYGSRLN